MCEHHASGVRNVLSRHLDESQNYPDSKDDVSASSFLYQLSQHVAYPGLPLRSTALLWSHIAHIAHIA